MADFSNAGIWTGQRWTSQTWETMAVDPYLVWAEATGFADLGGMPGRWVPLILELSLPVAQFAAEMAKRADNQGSRRWIELDRMYRQPAAGLGSTTFCTAIVTKTFFTKLARHKDPAGSAPLRDLIKRFELGLPIVSKLDIQTAQAPAIVHRAHKAGLPPACVVGIIDDGLAFAHERFRNPDGSTRIDFFWDQGYHAPDIDRPGYGRELSNAVIDALTAQCRSDGSVDEDAVYRLTGYREVRRRLAHGTVVMDLACGSKPAKVSDSSPHIVCVQLQMPSRRTRDRSAGWLAVRVLDGVRYILDRAAKIAPADCPVIVNLSFGNIAGPHDGSSIIEQALDQLIELRTAPGQRAGLEIVIAAGNSNLARCHARFSVAAGSKKSLSWRILPDDPTPNFLEVWLPQVGNGSQDVVLEVTAPSGTVCAGVVRPGSAQRWNAGNEALCTVVYLKRVATGDRTMILVAVAPTLSFEPRRAAAPSGTWTVTLENRNKRPMTVDAWIQRDETPFDFPRHGRQSRFEDAHYQRFDPCGRLKEDDAGNERSYIKRAGTVNSIATGDKTLVIGGFRRSDRAAAKYSSCGPALKPRTRARRVDPDVAAVSEDSVTCHGVLGAGARSGSIVAINGTSVAAPQITRWRAEQAIKPKPLPKVARAVKSVPSERSAESPRDAVRDLAEAEEYKMAPLHGTQLPGAGSGNNRPPQVRIGHGRIALPSPVTNKR